MTSSVRRCVSAMLVSQVFLILAGCGGGASPKTGGSTEPTLDEAIAVVRNYADSFAGKTLAEVKEALAGLQLVEQTWEEDGFKGQQLIATAPEYELQFFFSDDGALTTSVQVLSE